MGWKSRLPAIAAELDVKMEAIVHEGAEQIVDAAKGRVPVETGELRDAIHTEDGDLPGQVWVVAGDTKAFYGHIVEHGGARVPPRPFLVPAAEQEFPAIVAAAAAILKRL